MIFDRQYKIWDPGKQKSNIIIVGVGSVGSFVGLTLAKMGFENISVCDFDTVDEENIPNQFYREEDIGRDKTDALYSMIKDFTGVDICTYNNKWDISEFEDIISAGTIVVVAVDDMDVRKEIYEDLKEYPIRLVDCRMGGEGWEIYNVDLSRDEEKGAYEKRLDIEVSEEACGQKAIIYNILNLSSEVCNIIKRLDKEEECAKVVKRDMRGYRILSDYREEEKEEGVEKEVGEDG